MTHNRVPQPFTLDEPIDYEDGRVALSELNRRRVQTRHELEQAISDRIDAETAYRKARAEARIRADASDGAARKEQVDAFTADEWNLREKAQMKVDILEEKLEEIDGQRASLHRLVEWSQRLTVPIEPPRAVA